MTDNANPQNQIYFPVVGGASSTSTYGLRENPTGPGTQIHKGIDYGALEGTPVVAIKSGTITRIGWQSDDHSVGFGQRISIKYDDGSVYEGFYGHLSGFAEGLKTKFDSGKTVKVEAGQVIGYVGSTGASTGNHLHYEEAKFVNGKKVKTNDPTSELSKAIILNKDGTKIPAANSKGTLTTIIDFFSPVTTTISDFFKNFKSDVETIINSNQLAFAAKEAKLILGFNQETSYTIKSGDSLSKIAAANNTTIDKILEANPNIENPNIINAGDKIIIPVKTEQHSFNTFSGDKSIQLANSGMIGSDAVYVDSDGKPTSIYDSLFETKDSKGNKTTFIRDGVKVKAKDDSFVSLNSVVKTIDSAQALIQSFFFGSVDFGKDLLSAVGSIFDNTRPQLFDQNKNPLYLDANGNQTTQSYHYLTDEDGNQILDEEGNPVKQENTKATGPSNMELLLADFAARVATGADIDDASLETAKTAMAREISKELVAKIGLNDTQLQNGIAVAIARIGVIHMNGDDPDSQDYAIAAMEGILIAAGLPPAIVSGIISATNKILEEDGKLNSDEYQDVAAIAATTTIVAIVCIKVGAIVGSFFGPPVGTVIGAVVGAVVGYLIAVPLYNAVRDGWENSEQIYDAFEDIFKGDDIDEQLKEALKGVEDLAKDYTIDFIKDVGRGAIALFTGRYGKELKDGQYWNPYPSLNITPKADGTGNIIQGINPEGITAIAREYYHDDIYGTSGSDNLIGKSGTNTIIGYGGNDHIEGRGDIDLLIGGKGDDEIFGGNSDDQLYGSEGNDNLFGGNGNDIIIGGNGASISGEGNLEDGNDFIQGGNGDDQIMAEAGDDSIQGNAGNDTILGGNGNDRIEGNEGDDSILGEDGDDIILAGAGSDIIDGGNGIDVIEGNDGNDNIRGGDGNDDISGNSGVDIIYGDAGNDLINTGSENDLAFGGLGNDIIYGADGRKATQRVKTHCVFSFERQTATLLWLARAVLERSDKSSEVCLKKSDEVCLKGNLSLKKTYLKTTSLVFNTTETKVLSNNLKSCSSNNFNSNSNNKKLITNKIIISDKITVTNQFGGVETNGTGSEILKKIEFADEKVIANDNFLTDRKFQKRKKSKYE